MAKILSNSGISTTSTIEAGHITQSIDAFTGIEAYDITVSGSLQITGSVNITDEIIINTISASGNISGDTGSFNIGYFPTSSTSTILSDTGTVSIDSNLNVIGSIQASNLSEGSGSNSVAMYDTSSGTFFYTSSDSFIVLPTDTNFANTDLIFTGDRIHDTSGFNLTISTDGGLSQEGLFSITPLSVFLRKNNTIYQVTNDNHIFTIRNVADNSSLNLAQWANDEIKFNPTTNANFIVNGNNFGGSNVDNIPLLYMQISGSVDTNRIGIGTSSPQATLDIHASQSLSTYKVFNIRNSTDTSDLLQILGDGTLNISGSLVINNTDVSSSLYSGLKISESISQLGPSDYSNIVITQANGIESSSIKMFYKTIQNPFPFIQEERISLNQNETVINENTIDTDFRVESQTNEHMIFIPSNSDRVGIGKSSPNSTLDISGSTTITGSLNISGPLLQNGNTTLIGDATLQGNTTLIGSLDVTNLSEGSGSNSVAMYDTASGTFFYTSSDSFIVLPTDANFANTDLTFTGDRIHNHSSYSLTISDNNPTPQDSWLGMNDGVLKNRFRLGYGLSSYVTYSSSSYNLRVNGISTLYSTPTETVINDSIGLGGLDSNFRVESNANFNMLLIDGANNRVGIGKSSPNSTLDISGSTTITGSLNISENITAVSMSGDGSGLTGVTGEWDGTLDGNASITGSVTITEELIVSGSNGIFADELHLSGVVNNGIYFDDLSSGRTSISSNGPGNPLRIGIGHPGWSGAGIELIPTGSGGYPKRLTLDPLGNLSSSLFTSTASFGTYLGDGSQLTGISGGGIFAQTGSVQATSNDLEITGSSFVVRGVDGVSEQLNANFVTGNGPNQSVRVGIGALNLGSYTTYIYGGFSDKALLAEGDISSSANIYGVTGSFSHLTIESDNFNIDSSGNITSSANISASGDIVGNTLNLISTTDSTGFKFSKNLTSDLDLTRADGGAFNNFYIKSTLVEIATDLKVRGDTQLGNTATSSSISINGNITASNLPTTEPTTTGSMWISGSSVAHPNSGYLMIFNP